MQQGDSNRNGLGDRFAQCECRRRDLAPLHLPHRWILRIAHRIEFRRARNRNRNRARTRARNRIEATVKEYLLGCDRLEVYRTQIQAVADCRDAEYDMSAK